MLKSGTCAMLIRKASMVWPLRVRPLASVMVTLHINGHAHAPLLEDLVDGVEGGLGVERVEDGLHQQEVHAAFEQRFHLFLVGGHQLIEGARRGSRGRSRRD